MGLKIYCLNVNSVLKHLDELRIMAADKQPHIICLNETELDGETGDEDINCLLRDFKTSYVKRIVSL